MKIELAIQAWLDDSFELLDCNQIKHFDAEVRVNYHVVKAGPLSISTSIANPLLRAVPGSLWHSCTGTDEEEVYSRGFKIDLLFHETCVSMFRIPLKIYEHRDDNGTLVHGHPAHQAAHCLECDNVIIPPVEHENITIPYSDPNLFEKIISFSLNE